MLTYSLQGFFPQSISATAAEEGGGGEEDEGRKEEETALSFKFRCISLSSETADFSLLSLHSSLGCPSADRRLNGKTANETALLKSIILSLKVAP